MKPTILAALAAISAVALTAATAQAATFDYTGSLQNFTVRTTGVYDILAAGAQGGFGGATSGGSGALIGADLDLTAGESSTSSSAATAAAAAPAAAAADRSFMSLARRRL